MLFITKSITSYLFNKQNRATNLIRKNNKNILINQSINELIGAQRIKKIVNWKVHSYPHTQKNVGVLIIEKRIQSDRLLNQIAV